MSVSYSWCDHNISHFSGYYPVSSYSNSGTDVQQMSPQQQGSASRIENASSESSSDSKKVRNISKFYFS